MDYWHRLPRRKSRRGRPFRTPPLHRRAAGRGRRRTPGWEADYICLPAPAKDCLSSMNASRACKWMRRRIESNPHRPPSAQRPARRAPANPGRSPSGSPTFFCDTPAPGKKAASKTPSVVSQQDRILPPLVPRLPSTFTPQENASTSRPPLRHSTPSTNCCTSNVNPAFAGVTRLIVWRLRTLQIRIFRHPSESWGLGRDRHEARDAAFRRHDVQRKGDYVPCKPVSFFRHPSESWGLGRDRHEA